MRSLIATALAWAILAPAGPVGAGEPEPDDVREAEARAMRLVRKAADSYPEHRECFSCHHQTLPMLAMVAARGG